MPICRLQKNHALTRRGGLPPLFRLIHPQPLMTQAKQNKERFIYRRSARSLVSLSFSFPSFHPFLFLPFSPSPFPSPRRAPSLSRYFFRPPRTHQLVLTVSFAHSHSTPSPCPTYILSLPLSVSLSYLPTPLFHPLPLSLFLSFHGAARSLARSHARK